MSHNRRMFGGRPGGGPGGGGGHQMSPWEGGVVPGQGRPGTAGILGAAPQPLNLLSQLSTPEAQLALASNLLTSLLGQQQQQPPPMQQPRVPPGPQPLLSMNATAPGRGFFPRPDGMKHGGGPMRQQRNHGSRFPDNYKQRAGDGRPRPHAPIKRGGGPGGQPRTQRKSGGGTPNKSSPHAERKVPDSANISKTNADDSVNNEENDETVKSEPASGVKEEPKEDEEDEEAEEEKKRDWKDEKNKKESVMDVDEEQSKDPSNSESPGKGGKINEGAKGVPDASRYSTVPKDLLVCHICNKNMWDGQSFENHLRGKSHQMMMDQTEKSYKVQVKLMRQELKLAEEKREIEMERVQRLGKKVNIKSREYCTMCDLYFFGNIMGHRKNQLHQNLKNFLHPRCTFCSQEFPSRTEWDHHQLTPMHLQKLAEIRKSDGKDSSGEVAVMVEDKPELPDGEDGKQTEGTEAPSGESSATEGESTGAGAPAAGSAGGEPTEDKTAAAGTPGATSATASAGVKRPSGRQAVPPYDPKKSYGVNLLKKVVGYTCDVCNRFFFQHKEALAHCQTAPHYKSYVAHLYRTGAAAPPGSPTRAKQGSAPATAAAAGASGGAASASASDKSGGDKLQKKNLEETPESKRCRKEGDGSVDGKASDSLLEQTPQEQGADSTTESEVKEGDRQADGDEAESGAAQPATNGPDGPSETQADDPDDGADDEDDVKSDSAGTDKSVTAADESINMEETDALASANKVDEKKLSPSPANRRGVGRGMGRGRGRGNRRR